MYSTTNANILVYNILTNDEHSNFDINYNYKLNNLITYVLMDIMLIMK